MRKSALFVVGILIPLLTIGIMSPLAVAAVQFVEGFNYSYQVHTNAKYDAIWFGLRYTPTISYSLKRVELMAGSGTGNYIIQLRSESAGYPSTIVLRQTSFTMADTISWQGAEFAQSYALTAGTKYWIVFKPVPRSRASIIYGSPTGWTPITAVSSYSSSNGPWLYIINQFNGLPLGWMAKFYKESALASALTVTTPNGGQNWIRGTTHTITWTKSGSTGAYVRIELLKGGIVNRVITSSTANDGSYSWTIPKTQITGTNYKIRITSTSYPSMSDSSNSNFSIK
jgi:hypothetical protein